MNIRTFKVFLSFISQDLNEERELILNFDNLFESREPIYRELKYVLPVKLKLRFIQQSEYIVDVKQNIFLHSTSSPSQLSQIYHLIKSKSYILKENLQLLLTEKSFIPITQILNTEEENLDKYEAEIELTKNFILSNLDFFTSKELNEKEIYLLYFGIIQNIFSWVKSKENSIYGELGWLIERK